MIQEQWDGMRAAIALQPDFLAEAPAAFYDATAHAAPARPPSRIYLVGCGDSHYAGMAARWAVEHWTGVPVEPLGALEFSRYALRNAPPDAMVVAVSNSGEVARTVEAARWAGERGLWVVGVTSKPESRLAQASHAVFASTHPPVAFGPGTISYTASVLALMTLGLRVGRRVGRLGDTDVHDELARMAALGTVAAATLEATTEPVAALAQRIPAEAHVCVVGAGPNHGTALFGMAKMIEAARHDTVGQELEEWAHEQYFVTGEGSCTVMLACPGASLQRVREEAEAVRAVGGLCVIVGQADDTETLELADVALPVAGHVDELLSPLVYSLPLQTLACAYGVARQAAMLGVDDPVRNEVNFRQIFHSAIPATMPELGGRP